MDDVSAAGWARLQLLRVRASPGGEHLCGQLGDGAEETPSNRDSSSPTLWTLVENIMINVVYVLRVCQSRVQLGSAADG